MPTKTIGVREEVYERLRARKRDDESFTDLIDRLIDESEGDWREGFGSLSARWVHSWVGNVDRWSAIAVLYGVARTVLSLSPQMWLITVIESIRISTESGSHRTASARRPRWRAAYSATLLFVFDPTGRPSRASLPAAGPIPFALPTGSFA